MTEQTQPNKSTRTYEEWKESLQRLIERKDPAAIAGLTDQRVRPYYDQGLQPYTCYNELFNK